MRFFWTFFWTFLLIQMLNYVVTSMNGIPYDFNTGTILAVVTTLLIFGISAVLPNDPAHNNSH